MILNDECILNVALVTLVKINVVVVIIGQQRVLDVGRATEPLYAVVLIAVNLDVVDQGTMADTLQSQSVNLIIWTGNQAPSAIRT